MGRERDQDRSDCDDRPFLIGDRESEEDAGTVDVATLRDDHGGDAEDSAEHLLRMSDRQRVVGDGIRDAEREGQQDRYPAAPGGAQSRRDPDAESGQGDQAWKRREAVDE